MDSIHIKNFRSIVDSKEVNLSTINLLLGENSSGKSSLLRIFPMMKDTSDNELRGPLLWFDDNYDFGGFKESINRKASVENDAIMFSFSWTAIKEKMNIRCSQCTLFDRSQLGFLQSEKYTLSLYIGVIENRTVIKELCLKTDEHQLKLTTNRNTLKLAISVDGTDIITKPVMWEYNTKGIIPNLIFEDNYSPLENIQDFIDKNIDKAKTEKLYSDDFSFLFSTKSLNTEDVYNHITSDKNPFTRLLSKCLVKGSKISNAICQDIILRNIIRALHYSDYYLSSSFDETYYMSPIRHSFGRYIRNKELAVDHIDTTGKNVMEFILSLDEKEINQYNKFLHDTLEIKVVVTGDNNNSIMVENKDGEKYNIVDVGYGFTQIIPVATLLWDRARSRSSCEFPYIIEIEQPEVHLHPKMQSRLANLFAEAIILSKKKKSNLKLIIETHSAMLVNSLGRILRDSKQTNKQQLNSNDISIKLFEKKRGETVITTTEFDENGRINRWPIGFLD